MASILIIDDDPSIRAVFKRFLEAHGYSVAVAEDGVKGLQLLGDLRPDLLVTDVMMPQKKGLEVVLDLRRSHPEMPVIAISGGMRLAPMDFLPIIKKFGARKVFYKPVDLDELLVEIRQQLGV